MNRLRESHSVIANLHNLIHASFNYNAGENVDYQALWRLLEKFTGLRQEARVVPKGIEKDTRPTVVRKRDGSWAKSCQCQAMDALCWRRRETGLLVVFGGQC